MWVAYGRLRRCCDLPLPFKPRDTHTIFVEVAVLFEWARRRNDTAFSDAAAQKIGDSWRNSAKNINTGDKGRQMISTA